MEIVQWILIDAAACSTAAGDLKETQDYRRVRHGNAYTGYLQLWQTVKEFICIEESFT